MNSLWPSDTTWWHRSRSTLAQVIACCLTAPSHHQNQSWIINGILWYSPDSNFTRGAQNLYPSHVFWDCTFKFAITSIQICSFTVTCEHCCHPISVLACCLLCTVYPKKYAHGLVVLCFVVVMQSFIMNSHEVFIHIHQGCFAGTGAIVRLPQCQWSKPDGYGKISQCITTTKHSKSKTVCIFLGIYCMTCFYIKILIVFNMTQKNKIWW